MLLSYAFYAWFVREMWLGRTLCPLRLLDYVDLAPGAGIESIACGRCSIRCSRPIIGVAVRKTAMCSVRQLTTGEAAAE
jgi:hypothetical protein